MTSVASCALCAGGLPPFGQRYALPHRDDWFCSKACAWDASDAHVARTPVAADLSGLGARHNLEASGMFVHDEGIAARREFDEMSQGEFVNPPEVGTL